MSGADSNTKLMLHLNRPPGTSPKAVTFAGAAQLDTAQKKFGNSSLLLDGDGDYITLPDSSDWAFGGTSSFTIDFWIRANVLPASTEYWGICGQNASDVDHYYHISLYNNAGTYKFLFYTENNPTDQFYFTGNAVTIATGEWHHVALVRNGNDWTFYYDGQAAGNVTDAYSIPDMAGTFNIGGRNIAETGFDPKYWNGWIDAFRVSNYARWTGPFTVDTYAPVSDEKTIVMLHFDGSDAATATYDSAGGDENNLTDKSVTYVGGSISTADSKFGGACWFGTTANGSYLYTSDSPDWDFGTADFTIDMWFRVPANPARNTYFVTRDVGTWGADGFRLIGSNGGTGFYSVIGDSLQTISGVAWADNTWRHLAWILNTGTARLYMDGTNVSGTGHAAVQTITGTQGLMIGAYASSPGVGIFSHFGYIEEFRYSTGARWTANFTPPVAQYDASTGAATTVSVGQMTPMCGYWGGISV